MSSWGSKLLEQPYSFSCVKEVGGTYSNGAIQVRKSPGHIQSIHIGVITRLDIKDIKVFIFICRMVYLFCLCGAGLGSRWQAPVANSESSG